jgi:hypothetical protein
MKVRRMILRVTMAAEILHSVWLSGLRLWNSLGSYRKASGTFASFISFPRYIRIGLSGWVALMIVVSVSIMAGRHEVSDPFSAINALFAENARRVALEHGFKCKNSDWSNHPSDIADYCVLTNTDQIYSTIYLRLSGNVAEEVSLSLREPTLTLGDLVVLWGMPETHVFCESLVVSWATPQVKAMVAVPRTRHVNYFATIRMISFFREGSPSWKRTLLNDSLHGCKNN